MERDFHDVKFGYGIIGLGIYLVPIFIIAISFLLDYLKTLKKSLQLEIFVLD